MPTVPKNNKCRELGCTNPKTHRSCFCIEHGGGGTDKIRQNSKLYSSKAWLNARTAQLSKEPLCARCLTMGVVTQGEHIDHVIPHRRDHTKFHTGVLQTLCAPCHTYKTQQEANGIYIHFKPNKIIEYNANNDTISEYELTGSPEQPKGE